MTIKMKRITANERYHANIQNDGTFSVIPQMRGGVTDADQLIRLGEVAKIQCTIS